MEEQPDLELGTLDPGPIQPVLFDQQGIEWLKKQGILTWDDTDRIWRFHRTEIPANVLEGPARFLAAAGRRYANCTDLTGTEHKVIAYIAWRAGHKQVAWPSVETVAESIGKGRTATKDAIRGLEEKGYLRIVRRHGMANRYHLEVPTGPTDQATEVGRKSDQGGSEIRPGVGRKSDPEQVKRTSKPPEKGGDLFETEDLVASKPADLFAQLLPSEIVADIPAMIALGEFERHRRELKKPMTPTAIRRLCRKIRDWQAADICASIDQAIAKGWQDLYAPKGDQRPAEGAKRPDYGTDTF